MSAAAQAVPYNPETATIKPFGVKSVMFMGRPVQEDKFLTILHGSVRSSKTWTMMGKLLMLCEYPVKGARLISGATKQTIKRNVLNDLFTVIGRRNYNYNQQTGELSLFGVDWFVLGAKDEGSEKMIRGATLGLAYFDEFTELSESFVKMALNRLSVEGARAYGTTNPGNPRHYLKTEYMDNVEMRNKGYIEDIHFVLSDNPNNAPDYADKLAALYPPGGVYYKRFVLGQWVMAEGSIYADVYSDDLLYDELPKKFYAEEFIAHDYGVDHPNVFLKFYDDGKILWLDDELVWDSRLEGRQKTDEEYYEDLAKWPAYTTRTELILPPDAASFEAVVQKKGRWYSVADNEVLEGIRYTASMMHQRRLRINKRCARTIAEIPTYAWDPKKAKLGIEEPIKIGDDCNCALRYGVKSKVNQFRLTGRVA